MKIKIEGYYGKIFYPEIVGNELWFYPVRNSEHTSEIRVKLPSWLIEAIEIEVDDKERDAAQDVRNQIT